MESSKPQADEKVYQENKQETHVKKIYSNEPEDDSADQNEKHPTNPKVRQEEAVIESFPASDPPATSTPTKATPPKKQE